MAKQKILECPECKSKTNHIDAVTILGHGGDEYETRGRLVFRSMEDITIEKDFVEGLKYRTREPTVRIFLSCESCLAKWQQQISFHKGTVYADSVKAEEQVNA